MPEPAALDTATLRELVTAISRVRFGEVQVKIHDSRIVEICTTEKHRLPRE
jgi:hypothetical protein